jgi:hypothetical protein
MPKPCSIKISRLLKPLLSAMTVICLVLAPVSAPGSEQPEDTDSESEERTFMDVVDDYHAYLEGRVNEPATWFDNFFGDPRSDEEARTASFVRLRIAARYKESEKLEMPIRLRATLKLPRASRKLSLVIIGENPEEFRDSPADDDLARTTGEQPDEDRSSVGLRYMLYDSLRSILHFGGGVSSLAPFEFYLRVSYRRFLHIGKDNLVRFNQNGFWNSIDGFGETTRFDLEKKLPHRITGRVSMFGTHSEISSGVDWGVETSLYKQLTRKTAASFDLGAYGITRPDFEDTNYRIGVRTRANVLRPWLFLEIRPEVTFPLETETRRTVGAITVMMEIQFSDST